MSYTSKYIVRAIDDGTWGFEVCLRPPGNGSPKVLATMRDDPGSGIEAYLIAARIALLLDIDDIDRRDYEALNGPFVYSSHLPFSIALKMKQDSDKWINKKR